MSGKLGIGSLMGMVSLMAILGNTGGVVLEDNKVDVSDIGAVGAGLMGAVPVFMATDFKQVIPQASDLQAEEADQLLAHFKAEFNIPQDDLELTIEDVLTDIRDLSSIVVRNIKRFRRPA